MKGIIYDAYHALNCSVFTPLAVFIPSFVVRRPIRTTKDNSSSFLPVFVLDSTTRTMKIAQIRPDG